MSEPSPSPQLVESTTQLAVEEDVRARTAMIPLEEPEPAAAVT